MRKQLAQHVKQDKPSKHPYLLSQLHEITSQQVCVLLLASSSHAQHVCMRSPRPTLLLLP